MIIDNYKELPESIDWEITGIEIGTRVIKLLRIAWKPILLLVVIFTISEFSFLFTDPSSFYIWLDIMSGVIFIYTAVLLSKFILGNESGKYTINNDGVVIVKNNIEKRYEWDDLECFYVYTYQKNFVTDRGSYKENFAVKEINEAKSKMLGKSFLLERRQKNNKFIIVQSEPGNSLLVKNFLEKYLPRKEMTRLVQKRVEYPTLFH